MQATITKEANGTSTLTIKIVLGQPRESSKGTSMLIASETQKAAVQYEGHDVTIGLNAYYKKP